jgi:hypothetical protein
MEDENDERELRNHDAWLDIASRPDGNIGRFMH